MWQSYWSKHHKEIFNLYIYGIASESRYSPVNTKSPQVNSIYSYLWSYHQPVVLADTQTLMSVRILILSLTNSRNWNTFRNFTQLLPNFTQNILITTVSCVILISGNESERLIDGTTDQCIATPQSPDGVSVQYQFSVNSGCENGNDVTVCVTVD